MIFWNLALSVLLFIGIFGILATRPFVTVCAAVAVPLVAISLNFLKLVDLGSAKQADPAGTASRPGNGDRSEKGKQASKPSGWRTEYLWVRFSLLLVIAVLPSFAFFKVAYDFEKKLFIKQGQLNFAGALDERIKQRRKEYQKVKLGKSEDRIVQLHPKEEWETYQDLFFETTVKTTVDLPPSLAGFAQNRLDALFTRIRPAYNPIAADTQVLIPNRSADGVFEWCSDGENRLVLIKVESPFSTQGNTRCRAGRTQSESQARGKPGEERSDDPLVISSVWRPLVCKWKWWFGLAVIAFVVALYRFVRFVAQRIFVLDLDESPAMAAPCLPTTISTNLLALGRPFSGKSRRLNQRKDIRTFDIRTMAYPEPPRAAQAAAAGGGHTPSGSAAPPHGSGEIAAAAENWADRFDYRRLLPPDPTAPIGIDHFEHEIDNPLQNQQKLIFLEQLIYTHKRKVLIVSTVDPLFYFSSRGPGDHHQDLTEPQAHQSRPVRNIDRWTRVLSSFAKLDFDTEADPGFFGTEKEFADSLTEFKKRISGNGTKAAQELVHLFQKECNLTPRLRAIGKQVAFDLRPGAEMTSEELILEILARADAYYRAEWAACSEEEKLVLIQLAQEGLVNPKAKTTVWRLMTKGLVMRDPVFRIMNQSFGRFVSSAVPPDTIKKWEQEDAHAPWDTILLTVALGVAAFLFITQQAFFETWMAYLTGLGAAVPALVRVLGSFRPGSRDQPADA